jgi:Cu(I)/Ag(I) efflux system membrane fusion protein/cobalt-zinc-cadmium efflux system membrane fusion protein
MRKTLVVLVAGALASGCGSGDRGDRAAGAGAADGDRKVVYYKSPMDPSFIATEPGLDTMGMDLVPVFEGDPGANLDVIELSGAVIQQSGIRVEPVARERLTRIVRALGRVEFDESRIANVSMKFDGWIEKLWVDETGQRVERGDRLFSVYSPELLASQEEYLQILKGPVAGSHTQHLRRSGRQRLLQYDIPASFVDAIEKSGSAQRTVAFRSPRAGYVIHKTAVQGAFVKQGANLYTIADLDALWVIAEVYEFDAPWVYPGQTATIELDYLPGVTQQATVDYVYPVLDQKTRTLQVRLVMPNPAVALKPGMLATVRIHTEPVGDVLTVPIEAVIHSGERNIAFVHLGHGRFEPRELTLGVRGDEAYEVKIGLAQGESVVTSGQFLLDSESRLKEAVKKLLGSNLTITPAPAPAPAPAPDSQEHEHAR